MPSQAGQAGGRRIGRPTKPPTAGERIQIGVQVAPKVKGRLDADAEKNHRSLSREAELRLEGSFDRQDLLTDVLSLAYGRRVGAILMILGTVMGQAGIYELYSKAGGPLLDDSNDLTSWLDDPDAFEQAMLGVLAALEKLRPEGGISEPKRTTGEKVADKVVTVICSPPVAGPDGYKPVPDYTWDPKVIAKLLGNKIMRRVRGRMP
jgi:hypothetical protein